MKCAIHLKRLGYALSLTATLLATGIPQAVRAAPLALADAPLFLLDRVEPNILLTFDDSGSMSWAYLPDEIGRDAAIQNGPRGCSSTVNRVYYDPNVTYTAGVDEFGNSLGNASFTAAWEDGYNRGAGTRNLATDYQVTWNPVISTFFGPRRVSCGTAAGIGPQPAFFFQYDPAATGCSPAATTNDACYVLEQHSVTSTWTPAQRQNFANWYSYYRTRVLLAKTAAGRGFANLSTDIRVGYQRLNTCNASFGGAPSGACPGRVVRPFSGTDRTSFFNWLYSSPASGGTPLRGAFRRAGQYLETTGYRSPWAEDPNVSQGTEFSCRQNFHIAFTDGYWNGEGGFNVGGNVDNSSFTFTTADKPAPPDDYPFRPSYTPGGSFQQIFGDGNSNFLGDVAFRYWSRDLRPDLTNNVPRYIIESDLTGNEAQDFFNPAFDTAFWQHLVNFTVSFGVAGILNYPADYNDLLSGAQTWPTSDPLGQNRHHVDDLWHAAVNSRGAFFNAGNPDQLVDAFSNVINNIASRAGSAAAVATNTGVLTSTTLMFQARLNKNWSGQLLAFNLDPADGTVGALVWDAAVELNTQSYQSTGTNGRQIITYHPGNNDGVPFEWTDLDASQKTALNDNGNDSNGQARLEYLRGSSQNEGQNLNFRVRTCYQAGTSTVQSCNPDKGRLGDIVNSAPLVIGAPPFPYPDSFEASPYSGFASSYGSRDSIVYVGANDGMLHAFDEATGLEKLAYVPNEVYGNLAELTKRDYTHRYYVNGSPTAGDVYINPNGPGGAGGKQWRTVLVGGLGKGGRGYYALDITDPSQFSQSNASDLVLWEFTDDDLGYSFSQPSIVKMANGKWAAIFGNGYNNINPGNGHPVLYILFIEDGADGSWDAGDFVKIDVGNGYGDTNTPNGLATPAAVDADGDYIVDYIYAGDLRGNLWRFDVTGNNSNQWNNASNRSILFTAVDGGGNPQPITTRPAVGKHPQRLGGLMVYFGTGKYLEVTDDQPSGSVTQSFYGIWDNNGSAVARSDLLQQSILTQTPSYRTVSDNPMTWRFGSPAPTPSYMGWYLDLPDLGEKQVTRAFLREERIIFATLVPLADRCIPGGKGWIMELDSNNGGRLLATVDRNDDGVIDDNDRVNEGGEDVAIAGSATSGGPGGVTIVGGAVPPPGGGSCVEYKYTSTIDGKLERTPGQCKPLTRESWRQLK